MNGSSSVSWPVLDWANFTPLEALLGGLLIGVAAAAFLLLSGRIMGVSGIVGGLLSWRPGDRVWRWFFLGGMVVAAWLAMLVAPHSATGPAQQPLADTPMGVLVAAGLLVGLGTRYASGCTSGHGVCGLARFSLRSLVATASFMGAAMVTVYVMRHHLA